MKNELIIIGVFMLLLLINLLFIISRYKRCPADKILVIFGKVDISKYPEGVKIINGGGSFVWPIIQDYKFLDLSQTKYDFNIETKTKDLVPINLPGLITYSISNHKELSVNAGLRLLGKSKREIDLICQDIINASIIDFFANLDIIDVASSKERIIQQIIQKISTELNRIGIYIFNFRIDRIDDKKSLIKKYEQKFNTNNYINPDENLNKELNQINEKIKKNSLEREELLEQKLKILTKKNN